MLQLSLSFQNEANSNSYREQDFIALKENSAARNFLQEFFTQENFCVAQFPSLILKGQTSCGKTHLLHIFAHKFRAEFLEKSKISEINPAGFFKANKFYILEDIQEIENEEFLLRVINSAYESEAFLILTTNDFSHFQLKDLVSRLKNIFSVEIKNPDDDSVKQLLANGFSRKQIKLSSRLINLISQRIDRNYSDILSAIKRVETFCSQNSKALNAKEVKRIFEIN